MAKANDKPARGQSSSTGARRRPKTPVDLQDPPVAVANGNGGMIDEPIEPAAPAIDEETHQKYEEVKRGDLHIKDLQKLDVQALHEIAKQEGLSEYTGLSKSELIFKILKERIRQNGLMYGEGVLEILPDGFGFLRAPEYSYLPGPDDVYVSPSQIRRFNLRNGDALTGQVRAPKENERYFALIKVETINGQDPERARERILFESLTAVTPSEPLPVGGPGHPAGDALDAAVPLARGQRVLLAGPARSGKTTLLETIARGVVRNHPDVLVILALVAARPEDVTALEASLTAEVVSTTFDEPDTRHVQVAELAMERARRLVEHGRHVVLLVDTVNALVRASQATVPLSGRSLSGGLDLAALQKARRLFGSARAIAGGGSLTVVAAVEAEPDRPVDGAVLDELRGLENAAIWLDGEAARDGRHPAIDPRRSGVWRRGPRPA